jgi:hypothetical protein
MWFKIELPKEQNMAELSFESSENEFPKSFSVSVSSDGKTWKKVGEGKGISKLNTLRLEAQNTTRFIRIQTTLKSESPWSMKKLTLYAR